MLHWIRELLQSVCWLLTQIVYFSFLTISPTTWLKFTLSQPSGWSHYCLLLRPQPIPLGWLLLLTLILYNPFCWKSSNLQESNESSLPRPQSSLSDHCPPIPSTSGQLSRSLSSPCITVASTLMLWNGYGPCLAPFPSVLPTLCLWDSILNVPSAEASSTTQLYVASPHTALL